MNETNEQVLPSRPYRGSIPVVKEFDERHGKNSIIVGGFRTYEDGARRDADFDMGPIIEPPEDDFERLSLRVKYWQTLVDEAVEVFEETKHNFISAAKGASDWGHSPPNETEAVKRLEELKAFIEGRRKRLEAVQSELEATEGFQRRKTRVAMTAENRGRAHEFANSIRQVQI